MGIIAIYTDNPGQINIPNVRRVRIVTTDNLATVTAAGYLNPASLQGYNIFNTDEISMWYGATATQSGVTNPGTFGIFTPSISNGIITLVSWENSNLVVNNAPNTFTGTGSIILPKVNGTEASNAVTASGVAGVITTSALTTAGGASYAITWTNTVMTATSVVLLTLAGGTNTTENITLKIVAGPGSGTLTIYNNTAATALNGTILINYLLM